MKEKIMLENLAGKGLQKLSKTEGSKEDKRKVRGDLTFKGSLTVYSLNK